MKYEQILTEAAEFGVIVSTSKITGVVRFFENDDPDTHAGAWMVPGSRARTWIGYNANGKSFTSNNKYKCASWCLDEVCNGAS